MEVVALATWSGVPFPLLFLWCNENNIPHANALCLLFASLFPLVTLPFFFAKGEFFPEFLPKSSKWIRKGLYAWGLFLLILAAFLVYYTGGIQSSIFVWLFEYALIVTLIVGPVSIDGKKPLWRPVLLTGGLEIIIIVALAFLGKYSKSIPETMNNSIPFWGGGSVLYSLIVSTILFWFSIKKSGKVIKNDV
jgi:hypothetical protein